MNIMLSTYLNDHLAGSVAVLELARRSASANRDNPLGKDLERIAQEIEEDQAILQDVMRRLGVRRNPAKTWAAWGLEKLGRFKLNGRVVGYSPLSRLEELEAMLLGIEGKIMLWRSLRQAAPAGELDDVGFDELVARAERSQETLEEHRVRAVSDALASAGTTAGG